MDQTHTQGCCSRGVREQLLFRAQIEEMNLLYGSKINYYPIRQWYNKGIILFCLMVLKTCSIIPTQYCRPISRFQTTPKTCSPHFVVHSYTFPSFTHTHTHTYIYILSGPFLLLCKHMLSMLING